MNISSDLDQFLDAARAQGATDEMLMAVLRGRGWPEEDVYRVLSEYFESRSGLRVPPYRRSGSAKDAFLYLLAFSTLATWTFALGSAMFTLIERWFVDPLAPRGYYQTSYYEMAGALSALIIGFPVYLWVTRYIVRELESHPEKLDSAVRKWLTYVALLIAAAVLIGDLITFLTFFLRGELTARFVAKVSTVLLIAGGVFWYYFGSLRKGESLGSPVNTPPAGGST